MKIKAQLVAPRDSATPGAPLDPLTTPVRWMTITEFEFPFVGPFLAGSGKETFVLGGQGGRAEIFANYPAGLNVLDLADSRKVSTWLFQAGTQPVQKVVVTDDDYTLRLNFTGGGPGTAEFMEDWTWDKVLAQGIKVNGKKIAPVPEDPTEEADDILGTNADEFFDGLGGSDAIAGSGGRDTLLGGEGDDSLNGGKHSDSIEGGAGDDELKGGRGEDTLKGGDGEDLIEGQVGKDELHGGAGRNTLDGGAGADVLWGGYDGIQTFYDGPGRDVVHAHADSLYNYVYMGRGIDTYDTADARASFFFSDATAGIKRIAYDVDAHFMGGTLALDPSIVSRQKFGETARQAFIDLGYDIDFEGDTMVIDKPGDKRLKLVLDFGETIDEMAFWDTVRIDFGTTPIDDIA